MQARNAAIAPRSAHHPGTRVFVFFSLALLLTGGITLLFADLLWRRGWTAWSWILLLLFIPLMFLNTAGAMHGIYGFIIRRRGNDARITSLRAFEGQDISNASAVILFPIYNEDAAEVYARLKATYESLKKTGHLEGFDFFVLSDSTESPNWVDEETRWLGLTKELDGFGRIFYRRRLWNAEKKSGNIRDFLNAHGNRYRYMIVFDADSFMPGKTLVTLVKLMEAHPGVGMIQTPPGTINSQSLFGRMQQFASRLYGPMFTAGLNYWVQGFGNYVGHNAIIRTAPFMKYCDLPQLPGKKPFGGQILSHDFVEAALMLKNHWQVWHAYDLEESYEECPQGLIEYAQRDRRWCQGNMQHILVVFARGLRGISRLHLLFGIFGFLGGPLWLLFLLAFNAQGFFRQQTGLSQVTAPPVTPFLHMTGTQHALLAFALSTLVLLIPKFLTLVDLARDPKRAAAFGGVTRAALSVFLELLFSTLQAPLMMLWHTQFVVSTLVGRSVSWGKQNRQADGTGWAYAFRETWKHTVVGALWGFMLARFNPALLWWFSPLLIGFLCAAPLAVFSSRKSAGAKARKVGLFLTPEETLPSEDIVLLRRALDKAASDDESCDAEDVISDPYANALHVALLERGESEPTHEEAVQKLSAGQPAVALLRQKALDEGIGSLSGKEKLLLLSDLASVRALHRELWRRPSNRLAPPSRTALAKAR
jgi:membrane glycosyltransferase